MTTLITLRKRIDHIDHRLIRLVNQRAVLALQVGQLKHARAIPVFDRARETRVLDQLVKANRGPLSSASIRVIVRSILRQSRQLEAQQARQLHR